MTSQGHPITRLHRVLERPGTSILEIRAAAAELPCIALDDALAITLAMFDREPQTYPRAAARWAARLTIERRLPLVDVQLALAALAVLPGDAAAAGAEALIELAGRYRLHGVERTLVDWLRARGLAD